MWLGVWVAAIMLSVGLGLSALVLCVRAEK
jgi:hypothetical protein